MTMQDAAPVPAKAESLPVWRPTNLIRSSADWAYLWSKLRPDEESEAVRRMRRRLSPKGRHRRAAILLRKDRVDSFIGERIISLLVSGKNRDEQWQPPVLPNDPERIIGALCSWMFADAELIWRKACRYAANDGGSGRAGVLEDDQVSAEPRQWDITAERAAIAKQDLPRTLDAVRAALRSRRKSPAKEDLAKLLDLIQAAAQAGEERSLDSLSLTRHAAAARPAGADARLRANVVGFIARNDDGRLTATGILENFGATQHVFSDVPFDELFGEGWRERKADLRRRYALLDLLKKLIPDVQLALGDAAAKAAASKCNEQ